MNESILKGKKTFPAEIKFVPHLNMEPAGQIKKTIKMVKICDQI